MSNLTKHEPRLPAMQMDEAELMQVLQSSLYPGASPASIKMVLGYCKAAGLDPMQKPVHIVPMWDGKAGGNRDVVMPGIGLYRTQAARSGCAGVTEPEFGPDVTETIGGTQITFPAWCRVTVKRRLSTGEVVEFTAKEFWKENYAVKGGKERSIAPNAMWAKRPYGQIAKCAEAQALRKAFPEIGGEATADEMHGKSINEDFVDPHTGEIQQAAPTPRPERPPYPAERFDKKFPGWRDMVNDGSKTPADILAMVGSSYTLSPEQIKAITDLAITDVQPKTAAPIFPPADEHADFVDAME